MREVFDLLSRIQQRTGLPFLLIGGWALGAHKVDRFTNDVDCMTAVENDAALGAEFMKAGFECFEEMPAFRRFRHRLQPLLVLDVMRVDGATFAKMLPDSREHEFLGTKLRVPSLPHLLALKLHAARNEHRKGKDMPDILALLQANPGVVSPVELRQLCDRFGSPELIPLLARWL